MDREISILGRMMELKTRRRNHWFRHSSSVWEVYNGQIATMRRQGQTLQEIGDKVGVTRERVRQILKQYYGKVEKLILNESQLAKIIGCGQRLPKLRREGIVKPKRHGKFWYYDRIEAEKAMLALQRSCQHCWEPLAINQQGKYCPKCKKDYRRNPYPFRSDEGKRRQNEATRSWQNRNPERYREIEQRAAKKYLEKKRREHFAKTEYLVVYGEILPVDAVVKASGFDFINRRLILENGLRIPISHVRKIE